MDGIKAFVENWIDRGFERYVTARIQYDEVREYDEKQQALARHFAMSRDRLATLRINEQKISGILLNNTVYCLKKILSEQAETLEEGNYESERYSEPRVSYPLFRDLEVMPGIYEAVWSRATIFFKWKGSPFCVSMRDDRIMENTVIQVFSVSDAALKGFIDLFRDYQKTNHYLKGKKFIGLEGRLMPFSSYGWGDIILSDNIAEKVHSEVTGVLRSAKMLTHYGLNNKKGFILAGDPGNGKTLLLKILANTIDATCIMVPFSKNSSEKDMAAVFRLARLLAPTMLILEDVDLYGEDRDHVADGEYLGELMNELDGMIENKEIIVFATTNHLEKVEKALQNRPGRFDRVYKILNPDLQARRRLLEHFINKVPNKITREEIDDLAACFSGYSGAYLKELVNSGFAHAVLRDEHDPVLIFSDLEENLEVLKNKEKKPVIGFEVAVNRSRLEEARALRKEGP